MEDGMGHLWWHVTCAPRGLTQFSEEKPPLPTREDALWWLRSDLLNGKVSAIAAVNADEMLAAVLGELSGEGLVDAMLTLNLEPCPLCGRWTESGSLLNDMDEVDCCYACEWERKNGGPYD